MRWKKEQIFANREEAKLVASSMRYHWLKDLLSETGVDLAGCFPEETDDDKLYTQDDMTFEHRAQLRFVLNSGDIFISDNGDGGIQVYVGNNVIAEWKRPIYELREDLSKIDPKKKLFTVINIEYWSVFSDEIG